MDVWRLVMLVTLLVSALTAVPTGMVYFTQEPGDVTTTAGQKLVLLCEVKDRRRGDLSEFGPQCWWTKDSLKLTVDTNPRLSMAGCSLVVDPVLPGDEGQYRCSVDGADSRTATVKVVAEPGQPYITQGREGSVMEVEEDTIVKLECQTQGAKPAAELVWRYGSVSNKGLDITEDVRRLEDGLTWRTVSIVKFIPLEDQDVTCSARSDTFPELRHSLPLHLKLRFKPRIELTAVSTQLKDGEAASFKCQAQAFPTEVTYSWFINNNMIQGQSEATLSLERVGREHDEAEVKCRVENSVGASEEMVRLDVSYEPRILEQPASIVARLGEKVMFSCMAEGSPDPQYAWVKVGEGQEEVVGVSNKLRLTATKETEGQYVCKVFVSGHPALTSQPASLTLLKKPRVELEEKQMGRLGEAAVLQCKVLTLSNNTEVVWTRYPAPGQLDRIKEDNVMKKVVRKEAAITIYSELILPSLTEEDFTNYGCFASNEVGTHYRMVSLEQEYDTDYLSLIIAINTFLGLIVLAGILIYHYWKKQTTDTIHPGRSTPPPIYMGEDMGVFDEVILQNGMKENYGAISNEYFDNKNETKINLRIV